VKQRGHRQIVNWEQDFFFVHHRTISAVKSAEFLGVMMSLVVLRGRWCNIIVWNVHAPSEEKMMIQKRDFMGNYGRFSIIFLSTITKFCHNIKFDNSPF